VGELSSLAASFLKAFVPIFFTVDAIGILPIFISLTEGIEKRERQRIVRQSLITALLVALGFVLLGKTVFALLNIKVEDFEIAGGIILFIIATMDLVSAEKTRALGIETIGAVPLGTPLIVGPATLTMSLILVDLPSIGETPVIRLGATAAAIIVNIALAGLIFMSGDLLTRLLGKAGSRAVAKVAALILAAIAVMMIRKGIEVLFFAK
jgi:multiple antibiotic resistance protein